MGQRVGQAVIEIRVALMDRLQRQASPNIVIALVGNKVGQLNYNVEDDILKYSSTW